jgi:hypothetical protein
MDKAIAAGSIGVVIALAFVATSLAQISIPNVRSRGSSEVPPPGMIIRGQIPYVPPARPPEPVRQSADPRCEQLPAAVRQETPGC